MSLANIRWVGVVAATWILVGCGPARYVERPVFVGNAQNWSFQVVCMYESCSPEGWRLLNESVRIDILPSNQNLGKPVFIIEVRMWATDLGAHYTYDFAETYIAISGDSWQQGKVIDSSAARYLRGDTRDIYRKVAARLGVESSREVRETRRGKEVSFVDLPDMRLFLDIDPPTVGVPFRIRLAGLRRDGKTIYVPDVEFRFR